MGVKDKKKSRLGPGGVEALTLDELPEGAAGRIMLKNMKVNQLPKIDVTDPEQVKARILEYFQICADYETKPGIAGMAAALGMDRFQLYRISNNQPTPHATKLPFGVGPEVQRLIKQFYNTMEALWEDYMQTGGINPVVGIFLGKNNYGYRDQTEQVVSVEPKKEINAAEIKERYLPATDYVEVPPKESGEEPEPKKKHKKKDPG